MVHVHFWPPIFLILNKRLIEPAGHKDIWQINVRLLTRQINVDLYDKKIVLSKHFKIKVLNSNKFDSIYIFFRLRFFKMNSRKWIYVRIYVSQVN